MLSNLMHEFLKKVINSDGDLSEIISAYLPGECFLMAIDFELIYIRLLPNVKTAVDASDLEAQVLIALNFFNRLISGESLEKIAIQYNFSRRELLASMVYKIRVGLLKNIMEFV